MKKIDRCVGCRDNMYNHGGLHGRDKKCWKFDNAKVVFRRRVHVDTIPPYTNKKERFLDCYHQDRFAFLTY